MPQDAPEFVANPILNSPYEEPAWHWELTENGVPNGNKIRGRRSSRYFIPVPPPELAPQPQGDLELQTSESDNKERKKDNTQVNSVRREVSAWRKKPLDECDVSPATQRLLAHWRKPEGEAPQPRLFFCQLEAAETLIWLNEVAPKTKQGKKILKDIKAANEGANPGLFRVAAKMATGAGKTMVMAMLIAYHAINKSRAPKSPLWSNHFLVVTPGVTIKDRLRVLLPSDPENYYEKRGIVPPDMLDKVKSANVVITNYHALNMRETRKLSGRQREILAGNDPEGEKIDSTETQRQMLNRVASGFLRADNVVVINDEAHHCYKRKPDSAPDGKKNREDKEEAEENNEAARLWINGIYALSEQTSIKTVCDLSATPFFLKGSGFPEGDLFPWAVSDYSLMDAIESGIVKLPRVPIADATVTEDNLPIYRNLWQHIKNDLPSSNGAADGAAVSPRSHPLPDKLLTALAMLYQNYHETSAEWERNNVGVPPVFIIICNNIIVSKWIYGHVSGHQINGKWRRGAEELDLFNNVNPATNKPFDRPRTLLVHSKELESGDKQLSKKFKAAAAAEIDLFKREIRQREPHRDVAKITDGDLLREALNTTGKKGKLGERIRCVVSVSMLTEGWDANNVTHILGVRAFGTQLLCEQVVGRGLRRLSYELEDNGKFLPEYADVFGVPFDFAQGATIAKVKSPKPKTRVHSLPERANDLAIFYPRARGYTIKPSAKRIVANFTEDSNMRIPPEEAPPKTEQQGIIGKGVVLNLDALKSRRMSEVAFRLARHVCELHYQEKGGGIAPSRFRDLLPIVRRYIDDYVYCEGGTCKQYLLLPGFATKAAKSIHRACVEKDGKEALSLTVDTWAKEGDSFNVDFETGKTLLWKARKSHVNYAVCDSGWEMNLCALLEDDPRVVAYVRNERMGFEVPYAHGKEERMYRPDFIVRIDDGKAREEDDMLNLVIEVKGYRDEYARVKADTMRQLWVPAVNNDGDWGRWAFEEITNMREARQKLAKRAEGKE